MELIKYQHACFTVEQDDQILIVDPGEFSADFIAPDRVVGVVITHTHSDHFDHDQLAAIMDKNPDAVIVSHSEVTEKIEVFTTKTVVAGDVLEVGAFRLEFFGGEHAQIYPTIPPIANLGVMINELLYYPGDSFTLPEKPVDTLALPAAAPWMKASEAMDFLTAVNPRLAFPTHDAILSIEGKEIADNLLGMTAQQSGTEYKRLEEPLSI